jgi:hypothetical protein
MVEMRWVMRETPSGNGTVKVLQYRQLVDKTVYASMWAPESLKRMEMSEWKDVPVVHKED